MKLLSFNMMSLWLVLAVAVTLFVPATIEPARAEGKWPGLDEAVIERIAQEQGREATGPLINTDQGNLLLFLFLAAGAVGGFIAGYCWRILVTEKGAAAAKGAT
jgi:ABC-type cobalt transport system substrate-binding protein